jgi:hypothetical protein
MTTQETVEFFMVVVRSKVWPPMVSMNRAASSPPVRVSPTRRANGGSVVVATLGVDAGGAGVRDVLGEALAEVLDVTRAFAGPPPPPPHPAVTDTATTKPTTPMTIDAPVLLTAGT